MIALTWPDGSTTTADDAHDALVLVGKSQWDATRDVAEVKRLLSDRAWAWSMTAIDPMIDDYLFLAECDRAGLFQLEETE